MEEIRYSGGKEICVALGVTILLALFLFRVEDSYRIGLLLVAGALLLLRPLPFRKWSRLDGCVAALALSDLFSCFYAACPIPALDAAFYSVYMLATYFVCRRLFAHGRALQVLRVGSLFPIGAALLLAVCSLFSEARYWKPGSKIRIISAFCSVRWATSPTSGQKCC